MIAHDLELIICRWLQLKIVGLEMANIYTSCGCLGRSDSFRTVASGELNL